MRGNLELPESSRGGSNGRGRRGRHAGRGVAREESEPLGPQEKRVGGKCRGAGDSFRVGKVATEVRYSLRPHVGAPATPEVLS